LIGLQRDAVPHEPHPDITGSGRASRVLGHSKGLWHPQVTQ
jgi:hypothetical protein